LNAFLLLIKQRLNVAYASFVQEGNVAKNGW